MVAEYIPELQDILIKNKIDSSNIHDVFGDVRFYAYASSHAGLLKHIEDCKIFLSRGLCSAENWTIFVVPEGYTENSKKYLYVYLSLLNKEELCRILKLRAFL